MSEAHNLQLHPDYNTQLIQAVIHNNINHVLHCLDKGADIESLNGLANDDKEEDATGLLLAAEEGYAEILSLLIQRGAYLEATNCYGQTALHLAASKGRCRCVSALLAAGAQPNTRAIMSTPLSAAVTSGCAKTIGLLLSNASVIRSDTTCDALSLAISKGSGAILLQLVEAGTVLNNMDADGLRPIHVAVTQTESLECMNILLRAGVQVNIVDRVGMPPLHRAVFESGCVESVRLLLEHGADVNALDSTYSVMTAAHYAAHGGRTDVLRVLLDHGCDVNIPDRDGFLPLLRAISSSHMDASRLLIQENSDLTKCGIVSSFNISLRQPMDALQHACQQGMFGLCKLLHYAGTGNDHVRSAVAMMRARMESGSLSTARRRAISDLREALCYPRTLSNLSVLCIRRTMKGAPLRPRVHTLQLPGALKAKIMLEDFVVHHVEDTLPVNGNVEVLSHFMPLTWRIQADSSN